MAGATLEQQQETVPMNTTEADKINAEYKAFVAVKDVLAEQLEFSANSAANYAYGADLIDDDVYEKVFDRDMRSKSDAFKVMRLISCVRDKIKAATSREGARKKMNEFLDCLRRDVVFDELVKSLGEVQNFKILLSFTCTFCWSTITACAALLIDIANFEEHHFLAPSIY